MAANTSPSLLSTFQQHIEDMRNLVYCKICLKPLYEPHVLTCGHSYCYTCLTNWFGGNGPNRKRDKRCPDCRARIAVQPAPNYLLRELVHMFVGRTELLPEDETVDEHETAKNEESALMTTHRTGEGLFGGAFSNPHLGRLAAVQHMPIPDVADGVMRCPRCTWELEDGQCLHCGYDAHEHDFSEDDYDSDSDDRYDLSSPTDMSEQDHDIDAEDAELDDDYTGRVAAMDRDYQRREHRRQEARRERDAHRLDNQIRHRLGVADFTRWAQENAEHLRQEEADNMLRQAGAEPRRNRDVTPYSDIFSEDDMSRNDLSGTTTDYASEDDRIPGLYGSEPDVGDRSGSDDDESASDLGGFVVRSDEEQEGPDEEDTENDSGEDDASSIDARRPRQQQPFYGIPFGSDSESSQDSDSDSDRTATRSTHDTTGLTHSDDESREVTPVPQRKPLQRRGPRFIVVDDDEEEEGDDQQTMDELPRRPGRSQPRQPPVVVDLTTPQSRQDRTNHLNQRRNIRGRGRETPERRLSTPPLQATRDGIGSPARQPLRRLRGRPQIDASRRGRQALVR